MAFDGLSSRLQEITRKLKGKARITEDDLKEYGVSLECFLIKNRIFWEED